jgi:predicted nucleic-acid-binding protein
MIGLDTHVLVRLLTGDDPAQYALVRDLIERHRDEPSAFYIDDLVLVETYWVLTRRYALGRDEVLSAFERVASNLGYGFDDRALLIAAIVNARERQADFADTLIVRRNARAGCDHTVTFDTRLARLDQVRRLGA